LKIDNVRLLALSDSLKKVLDKFKQKDDYYYQAAIESQNSGRLQESNEFAQEMIDRFPKSTLVKDAIRLIAENRKEFDRKKEDEQRAGCDLELITWTWGEEARGTYFFASGQVKNISDHNLKNVTAVLNLYDVRGMFAKSDKAMIEYNPLLPGQTSPFKVMSTANPLINKAQIEFKELLGGTISTYRRIK